VEIDFSLSAGSPSDGLRALHRDQLDDLMSLAACTIVSSRTNEELDAYVLSESSLFVYPTKWVLKVRGAGVLFEEWVGLAVWVGLGWVGFGVDSVCGFGVGVGAPILSPTSHKTTVLQQAARSPCKWQPNHAPNAPPPVPPYNPMTDLRHHQAAQRGAAPPGAGVIPPLHDAAPLQVLPG